MATFLLVHGAFQGGWVWRPVASLLRKSNHEVYTPTLTGAGERVHLLDRGIDLNTYLCDVANVINFEGLSDVILVGHGYGGMVITALADKLPGRVSRLVYLDAIVPKAGKSFLDMAGPEFRRLLEEHVTGWQVRPWPIDMFGIECEEVRRWFSSKLVRFPLDAFNSVFQENWQDGPVARTYIHCTKYGSPFIKRMAARRQREGWDYYEMKTGPSAMIAMPDRLAGILNQIALSNEYPEASQTDFRITGRGFYESRDAKSTS